jgi:hypothetical protein
MKRVQAHGLLDPRKAFDRMPLRHKEIPHRNRTVRVIRVQLYGPPDVMLGDVKFAHVLKNLSEDAVATALLRVQVDATPRHHA